MDSPPAPGRTLATKLGLPLVALFTGGSAIAGTLTGGPPGGLVAGAAGLAGSAALVGGILGLISAVHVLAITRGGAVRPGDAQSGFSVDVELGGDPPSAHERAREALLGLSGAALVRDDPAAGELEVRADGRRFGAKARHTIRARVEGTAVHALVRHDDPSRPFDFGSTTRQADALEQALRERVVVAPEVGDLGSERPRQPHRQAE